MVRYRLTVAQAADQLDISEDAVRSRIKRGTLRSEREGGAVVVLLDADRPAPDQPTGQTTEGMPDPKDELIEELRARIASLERQLAEAHEHLRTQLAEAHSRDQENRRIIAGLMQRIPASSALESSPEKPPDAPQSAFEEPGRGEATHAPERSAQTLTQRLRRWVRGG